MNAVFSIENLSVALSIETRGESIYCFQLRATGVNLKKMSRFVLHTFNAAAKIHSIRPLLSMAEGISHCYC